MPPKKNNTESDDSGNSTAVFAELFRKMEDNFTKNLSMLQVSNTKLLESLTINIGASIAQSSDQIMLSIKDLKSDVLKNEPHVKKMTEDITLNRIIPEIKNNINYIMAFKELGGSNISFKPNDTSAQPMAFIKELQSIFELAQVPDEKRVVFAIKSLKGSAVDWAYIKRNNFTGFEDFRNMFLERYGGAEKERELYAKLKFGEYRYGSRADYFIKMVKENNYLSEPCSETELIKMLARHFDWETRRGILNGGYRTYDEVEGYLRELDGVFENKNDNGTRNSNNNGRNWRSHGVSDRNNRASDDAPRKNLYAGTDRSEPQNETNSRRRNEQTCADQDRYRTDSRGGSNVNTLFDQNSEFLLEEEGKQSTGKG